MRLSPLLRQLESVKSMMRYMPPNGTAGFARFLVSGYSRSPWPPASNMTSVVAVARIASCRLDSGPSDHGSDGFTQRFEARRLGDVGVGDPADEMVGIRRVRRVEHNRQAWMALVDAGQRREAVETRHVDVEDDRVRRMALDREERFEAVPSLEHLVPTVLEILAVEQALVVVVLYDQNSRHDDLHVGSTISTVVPASCELRTAIVPAWSLMILRTTANPRPEPCRLVVKNGVKICG